MRDALILKDKSIYVSGAKTSLNVHICVSKPITGVEERKHFLKTGLDPFLAFGVSCVICCSDEVEDYLQCCEHSDESN